MFNQYTYFALLAAKFFGLQDLWSSQNVFGPPTAGCVVVDFKDRAVSDIQQPEFESRTDKAIITDGPD